jgi:hypothetical protein
MSNGYERALFNLHDQGPTHFDSFGVVSGESETTYSTIKGSVNKAFSSIKARHFATISMNRSELILEHDVACII